jgi:hypothetical protein
LVLPLQLQLLPLFRSLLTITIFCEFLRNFTGVCCWRGATWSLRTVDAFSRWQVLRHSLRIFDVLARLVFVLLVLLRVLAARSSSSSVVTAGSSVDVRSLAAAVGSASAAVSGWSSHVGTVDLSLAMAVGPLLLPAASSSAAGCSHVLVRWGPSSVGLHLYIRLYSNYKIRAR